MSREHGFTLLEIIATLILLGILASVAAPKFFDLSEGAELKAAQAAASDVQVRINAIYSKGIYAGLSCSDAVKTVSDLSFFADRNDSKGALFGAFYFQAKDGTSISSDGTKVTATSLSSGKVFKEVATVYVPTCLNPDEEDDPLTPSPEGDSGSSSEGGSSEGSSSTGDSSESGSTDAGTPSSGSSDAGASDSSSSQSGSSSSSSNRPANCPADFPHPMATWPSVADGGSGTVIASNGAYYTVRFWATFSDAEKTGAIEDTSAYQSGSLVKLNFNVWPIKSDSTNEWTPALNPGYLVKHRDSGDYYVWVGDNGTTTASAPWESSTDSWVNLGQSN